MSVVRTSDEWLSSSRWMAAVHPVTALPLFPPVLTQQPSLSPLHHGLRRAVRLVICSAKAGGPCGRTAPSHGESGQGEYVRDLDRESLASGKLYPPLTRTVARARGPPSLLSDAPRRRTTCPRGTSRGTLLRRMRGFPGCNRLVRAFPRRAVHAYRTA